MGAGLVSIVVPLLDLVTRKSVICAKDQSKVTQQPFLLFLSFSDILGSMFEYEFPPAGAEVCKEGAVSASPY